MTILWDFIEANFFPIITLTAGLIAWLFDRRKHRAEIQGIMAENKRIAAESKSSEADALKNMQSAYDKFVVDMNAQMLALRRIVSERDIEIAELKETVGILERRLKIYDEKLKNYEIK